MMVSSAMSKPTRARRGENHYAARLRADDVRQMRRLHYTDGLCVRCIAIIYSRPYPTVWDAINFETWKHVD